MEKPPVDLSALVDIMPYSVLVLDDDNRFLYVNSSAQFLLQSSKRILLNQQRLDDFFTVGTPLLSLVDQVRRQGRSVNEYGLYLSSPQNEQRQLVDVFASLLPDHKNAVVVVLQQRNMAQMIERQLAHRSAARSITGMAAMLAHEIKNPLSGIRGAAQLLEADLTSEDDRALTQLVCAETDRICGLVDKMEAFGDGYNLEVEPINIHEVLEYVRKIAENGFASHIHFIEDYDPSLPLISGNRDRLVQAFLNLLKNAAESISGSRSSGEIRVATAFRPGVKMSVAGTQAMVSLPLQITITDNGSGIPEDIQPHLFDPFVTSKTNGTGLGLPLVAKIVEDHGGVIEFRTGPEHTVFQVLLPMLRG